MGLVVKTAVEFNIILLLYIIATEVLNLVEAKSLGADRYDYNIKPRHGLLRVWDWWAKR